MPFVHTRDIFILNGAALLMASYLGTTQDSCIAPLVLIALYIYITVTYAILSVRDIEDKLNQHIDATTEQEDYEEEEDVEEEVEDKDVEEEDAPEEEEEDAPEEEDDEEEEDDTLSDSPQNGLHPHTEAEDEHYCAEETCCKQIASNSGAGKCARCNLVYYCDQECQKKDWKAGHKLVCQSKEDAPVIESVVEATVEPVVESVVEPVVEPLAEHVAELVDLTAPDPSSAPVPSTELPTISTPLDTPVKMTTAPPPPSTWRNLPPPPPL
jgi:hypothetical protein